MRRDEKTSQRVAKIAARVLATKHEFDCARDLAGNRVGSHKFCSVSEREWRDIRALAASCLTQAPAKPKANKPR